MQALGKRIADLENRIAELEQAIKQIEQRIAAPDFYADPNAARPILEEHQSLMWQVGDLLGQWEMLQEQSQSHEDPQGS
jgi:ATP-binding cassette subfamily F protein 3